MVRTAFLTLLLLTLAVVSASAARIAPARPRAHATISKSALHAPRRSSLRVSHPSKARGTRRSLASASRRPRSYGRSATLRRARYSPPRSRARFVPTSDSAATPLPGLAFTGSRSGRSTPVSDSAPNSVEPSGEASSAPRETDTLPAPGTDPAVMASAGNPLAAPRDSRPAIPATSGQVAELTRPRLFTGRVTSYTLRGNHDSLVRQNQRSEEENLQRIENDADLQDRIDRGQLVRVPESAGLLVNPVLPENRRYCRPWTAEFLTRLASSHQAQFHSPLIVSSAVRTVEFQSHLMRINGNAADAEGEIVSPHLTGATIDIAKSGLSRRQLQWMRSELLAYQNAGVIDVEEEFHQRCFHITVYNNYGSGSPQRQSIQAAGPTTESQDSTVPGTTLPENR